MSFGAKITTGDDNTVLPDALSKWLVEARVEQELSKPTKFAIRFEDDICEGEWAVAKATDAEFRTNTMISVLAKADKKSNKLACLVRGRITKVKSSTQIGGTGSWLEIHGEDRRVEMDRTSVQAKWTGPPTNIIKSVLLGYDFKPEVENIPPPTEDDKEFNQSGTDLAFLNKLASENGLEFWIEYDVKDPPPFTDGIPVTETASLKISPPESGGSNVPGLFTLVPDKGVPSFRVNVQGDLCPNVNAFQVEVDAERPTRVNGSSVEFGEVTTTVVDTTAKPAPVGEGTDIVEFGGAVRTINQPEPGGPEEQNRRNEAALREAAWFVDGSVSTSVHQFGSVLSPHEVINVKGAGAQLNIPYQIKSVIHVINASDHMMDVKMRSNILGKKTKKKGIL